MKKYFNLLVVVMIAAFSLTLTSCGDDDDDNGPLVGTWECTEIDEDGDVYYQTITFNKDNTFYTTLAESYNNQTYSKTLYGTYAISGDIKKGAAITMNFIDEDGDTWTENGAVRVDGKKAYVSLDGDGEQIFTKK